MDFKTQHFVRYWSHTRELPEPHDVACEPIAPKAVPCPDPYFCFEFVEMMSTAFEWPDGVAGGATKAKSISPTYYPGGSIATAEEIIAEHPDNEPLPGKLEQLAKAGITSLMRDRNGMPREATPIEEHVALPEVDRLGCCCGERLGFVETYEFGRDPKTVYRFECSCGHRVNYPEWPADAPGDAP